MVFLRTCADESLSLEEIDENFTIIINLFFINSFTLYRGTNYFGQQLSHIVIVTKFKCVKRKNL